MNQSAMTMRRFLLLIIIAALLAPYTLEISMQNMPDNSFTRYSIITILLTLFYESGATIAGPYSTAFILPPTSAILLNGLTLIVNITIILGQVGYVKSMISKRSTLYIIGTSLCVHVLLLIGVFSYQLNGTTSVLAIPLPIFPIIAAITILRTKIPNL